MSKEKRLERQMLKVRIRLKNALRAKFVESKKIVQSEEISTTNNQADFQKTFQ